MTSVGGNGCGGGRELTRCRYRYMPCTGTSDVPCFFLCRPTCLLSSLELVAAAKLARTAPGE